jgi:hypothetical protein
MNTEYINFKHENNISKFLASVSVPSAYLYYSNLVEYSDAKQLLKTDTLNAQDRSVLDLFTRHWVIKHGEITQARLDDIRRRLNHYNHKQNNMALRQQRLQRKAVKKIAALKKSV